MNEKKIFGHLRALRNWNHNWGRWGGGAVGKLQQAGKRGLAISSSRPEAAAVGIQIGRPVNKGVPSWMGCT